MPYAQQLSYDAESLSKENDKASIQKGLKAICFTDRYDKDDDDRLGRGRADF